MNVTSSLPPSAPPSGDAAPAENSAGGSTFADLLARQLPENSLPKGERASPKERFDRDTATDAAAAKPKPEDAVTEASDVTATNAVPTPPAAPAAPVVIAAHQPHDAKEAAEPASDAEPQSDATVVALPDASAVAGAEHAKPAAAASPVAIAAIVAAAVAQSEVATPETGTAQPSATSPAIDVVASAPAANRARTAQGIPAQAADVASGDATAPVSQAAHPNPALPATQPAAPPAADASAIAQSARNDAPVAARPAHFASDVAVEVVRQAAAGRHEFTIRLDPPDLGRIDVSLEFHRGEVRAVVSTDNPATHDLLRRDADGFARVLTDSGFRADGGALRFDLRDGSQQRGFAAAGGRDGFGQSAAANDPISAPQPVRRRGLLDLVA